MGTFTIGESRLRGGDRLRATATPDAPPLSTTVLGTLVTDGFRFAGGRLMNALARMAIPPIMFPAAETIRPVSLLYDGRPGSQARFSAVHSTPIISGDLNMLRGSKGDNQTDVAEWTEEHGADLTLDLVFKVGGSLKLLSSSDFGQRALGTSAYQDIPCRPGEALRLIGDAYGGGSAAEAATLAVQNLASGYWLNTSGAWVPARTVAFQQNAAAWATADLTFQVQGIEACRGYDEPVLRFRMGRPQGASENVPAYFANMAMWPAIGFIGVWWQNILGNFTIDYYGADTNLRDAQVLITSLAPKRRVTFYDFSTQPQSFRYFDIVINGGGYTTEEPVEIGELVLTTLEDLSALRDIGPQLDAGLEAKVPQARFSNAAGGSFVHLDLDHYISKARLSFMLAGQSELVAVTDRLWGVSRGGATPSIITGLDGMGADICLFGRFEDTLPKAFPSRGRDGTVFLKADVPFQEEPGPLT